MIFDNYIGKRVIIYTLDGGAETGTVEKVTDGAILIRCLDDKTKIINTELMIKLEDYPEKKKKVKE